MQGKANKDVIDFSSHELKPIMEERLRKGNGRKIRETQKEKIVRQYSDNGKNNALGVVGFF